VNPYNETPIPHEAQAASASDVDAAVAAAKTAYKTSWASFSPAQRQACMLKFADLVERDAERLAILESLPTGKPVTPTMQFDIAHMVEVWRCTLRAHHTNILPLSFTFTEKAD
jgi:acyl-CoA reductase-like NAD-dependent aldehyde dehydrogenase